MKRTARKGTSVKQKPASGSGSRESGRLGSKSGPRGDRPVAFAVGGERGGWGVKVFKKTAGFSQQRQQLLVSGLAFLALQSHRASL